MMVTILFWRPVTVVKDQRPNSRGSWPDDMIPLQMGCNDKIVAPPGLYNVFQGIYVSDIKMWECFQ